MSGGELDIQLLNTQAEVHLVKSEYVEACRIHTQILHAAPIEQNPNAHAFALLTMAEIGVEICALRDEVHRNISAAKQLFNSTGYSRGFVFCDTVMAALYVNERDFLRAKNLFQACLRSTWGQCTEAVTYCLERLGNASLWLAIDSASYNWTATFLAHSVKVKQKLQLHKALQFLGDLYLAEGDQQTAITLLTVALEGFTKMDVHRSRAECMIRLGDIAGLHGDISKAEEFWNTARPLFERSSQTKQVGHIDERLARMNNLSEHHLELIVQLSTLNAWDTCSDTGNVGRRMGSGLL
ncbi:hypothetical protein FB451DRAFT_1516032 [Mycena latifolia]|nr:hypothetical protein FB451DRAFT_1516032 [Mycena latifolia]